MHTFGSGIILFGLAAVMLSQLWGAIMVFSVSILKGILSLIIPGYFLFALRREGMYARIVGSWGLGILCMAIGTIVLS
jgi:hypothetical protein